MTAAKDATLDLRLTPSQKEVIRRAAALRGQTMTDFVMSTVEPVARAMVERERVIELGEAAWKNFLEIVDGEIPASSLARKEASDFLEEMKTRSGRVRR